ncbi:sulfotransferase family 2 domain-containing protein [Microcoleus sp. N3A4]|uniref:sulfotransferase family 2 domain-containing protein n=1 Tax=Microcoleus sp. N3A4 TaxID=3055379 RepID=UPI002FD3A811
MLGIKMIISYTHKFIFLKTRKTGSSSIQVALSLRCGDNDIIVGDENINGSNVDRNIDKAFSRNDHVNLMQMKIAIPDKIWNSFFKFAFVRNPWDLVVSRYYWEKKGIGCSAADFRDWLPRYVNSDYAEPERNSRGNIVKRIWEIGGGYINDLQTPFVFDKETIGIQFVGRYETLSTDFDAVCRTLGIKTPPLPHLKSGFRKIRRHHELYDDLSRRLVERAFATDIDHFGYVF